MQDQIIELANRITEEIKGFLLACKNEGDETIEDVLKRLKALKKQFLNPIIINMSTFGGI